MLEILIVILGALFVGITYILAEHKEELWDEILYKGANNEQEKDDNNK